MARDLSKIVLPTASPKPELPKKKKKKKEEEEEDEWELGQPSVPGPGSN